MLYRLFAAALAAGVLSAVLLTAVESVTTTPLILQAERFEPIAHTHDGAPPSQTEHAHEADAWAPENGLERHIATLVANTVTGIAFALLVAVGLTFGKLEPGPVKGVLIAGGGFCAFTLAPVLGLPPELPGMPAADLQARQVWWGATAALTGGGLIALTFWKASPLKALGIALVLAPHVWGAPHPPSDESLVSAALAAQFAAASIAVSALFWGLIGFLTPWFWTRIPIKISR